MIEDLTEKIEYLSRFISEERFKKIENCANLSSNFLMPITEDVFQYRNAAAIVRSVEANGFHKVIALEENYIFNPNTKVTRGADNWVEVEKMPRNTSSLQEIKNRGYKLLAVSPERNAITLSEYKITEPTALLFGTEMDGISQELLDYADDTLSIPMYGFTQSYNVSVAAGICFYNFKQQLENSGIDYKLNQHQSKVFQLKCLLKSIKDGDKILEIYNSRK